MNLLQSLFPVQRVVAKLIRGESLDGMQKFSVRSFEPNGSGWTWTSTDYTERSYVQMLYKEGRCSVPESGDPVREAFLVMGRGSGKSTLAATLAALEMADRVSQEYQQGTIRFMAIHPTPHTLKEHLSLMVALAMQVPDLTSRVANDAATHMRFQTDKDIRETGTWVGSQRSASAQLQLGNRSSFAPKGLRGYPYGFFCLDEPDAMCEGQDLEAWQSGQPGTDSVKGKAVAIGTPQGGHTWFRGRFENTMIHPKGLAVRIPSWEAHPGTPAEFFEQEYQKNPLRFWTEYGGYFVNMEVRPVGVPSYVSPVRVGVSMTPLNEIGQRHREWQDRNFDGISVLTQGLVLAEECGEVARAIVKEHHGIRAHDRGNLAEELADVILVATALAARAGIDMDAALASKAARRDLKDFRARPETG